MEYVILENRALYLWETSTHTMVEIPRKDMYEIKPDRE